VQSFKADEIQVPPGTLMGSPDRNDPFYTELPLLAAKLRAFSAEPAVG
jgi:hypothetical protein